LKQPFHHQLRRSFQKLLFTALLLINLWYTILRGRGWGQITSEYFIKYQLLEQKYKTAENKKSELLDSNNQLKNLLQDAQKEIERLNGLLNTDGTNSGIPASKTPVSKPKVIPNSREKTGKNRGGQRGRPKRKLGILQ
jgi:hypothetical protein